MEQHRRTTYFIQARNSYAVFEAAQAWLNPELLALGICTEDIECSAAMIAELAEWNQ